jgi:hypothetical protein
MISRKLRPLFETTALAGAAFGLHFALLHLVWPATRRAVWQHDIATIYGFFFASSLVIVSILIAVKQKNIDSVGNTFMLLTCIKAALAYIMLHPILQSQQPDVNFEKINFFVVFAVFLTIETIVSIRLVQEH